MYVRGNGIRIAGATDDQADAFDFVYPFAFLWRHATRTSDSTGWRQQYTQTSLGINEPGSILLRFLGKPSETPRLPVGTRLTSLTLTFASGQTIALDSTNDPPAWAVVHEAAVNADKNGAVIDGSYRIALSGPVTPGFGPDRD